MPHSIILIYAFVEKFYFRKFITYELLNKDSFREKILTNRKNIIIHWLIFSYTTNIVFENVHKLCKESN